MSWTTTRSSAGPLALAVLSALVLAGAARAQDDAAAAATAAVSDVMNQVIALGRDKSISPAEKRSRIEAIAMDGFDWPTMSRLVLARNWKKLSDTQKPEFIEQFKKHLSLTYGKRLEQIGDEKVDIGASRVSKNGDVTVKTKIVGGAADGVLIDYRLRENEGEWRVIDVIIEGVSLVANFRSQSREIVSRSGIDQLIAQLREKNEKASAPAE